MELKSEMYINIGLKGGFKNWYLEQQEKTMSDVSRDDVICYEDVFVEVDGFAVFKIFADYHGSKKFYFSVCDKICGNRFFEINNDFIVDSIEVINEDGSSKTFSKYKLSKHDRFTSFVFNYGSLELNDHISVTVKRKEKEVDYSEWHSTKGFTDLDWRRYENKTCDVEVGDGEIRQYSLGAYVYNPWTCHFHFKAKDFKGKEGYLANLFTVKRIKISKDQNAWIYPKDFTAKDWAQFICKNVEIECVDGESYEFELSGVMQFQFTVVESGGPSSGLCMISLENERKFKCYRIKRIRVIDAK